MKMALRRASDSADAPSYLHRFKLHTPPFTGKTGSAFFYADAERTQHLEMLHDLTEKGEQPLLVVGDKGLGKSALIDKYLERVGGHWRLCRHHAAGEGGNLASLSARVAECFAAELGRVEPTQLLDILGEHLDTLLGLQLPVLVIDDAHALSDDALERVLQLATLEGLGGRMIRVLLFADSSIDGRLQSPRLASIANPYRIELKPLQEWDSGVYLLHRLQRAGLSGNSPFSAADMKQLYRQGRGIPAELNHAAHKLLMERCKHSSTWFGLSGSSLGYGAAAIALIAIVLLLHDRINVALLGGSAAVLAEPQVVVPTQEVKAEPPPDAPLPEAVETEKAGMTSEVVPAIAKQESVSATEPSPPLVLKPGPGSLEPSPEMRVMIQGSDWVAAQPDGNFTLQLMATSEPRALTEFVVEHPVIKGPLGRFEHQLGDKRLHVLTQGSYPNRAQAETAANGLPNKLKPWIRDFAGIKKIMTKPASKSAVTMAVSSGGIKDTAWVWSQNPSHYTIQLSGAADEASIEAEMHGLSLRGELALVQTLRNGKPWYVLIYGRFADKAAAQGASARLPASLKKSTPWIRRFSALHDEIGQAGVR